MIKAAHAGPHAQASRSRGLTRQAGRLPAHAVILGLDCPAHGHRVKIAAGVAAQSASLNLTRPAHQGIGACENDAPDQQGPDDSYPRWLRDDRQGRTPVFSAEEFVLLTYCP